MTSALGLARQQRVQALRCQGWVVCAEAPRLGPAQTVDELPRHAKPTAIGIERRVVAVGDADAAAGDLHWLWRTSLDSKGDLFAFACHL